MTASSSNGASTNKKKLYSYCEARRIARQYGFIDRQEFIEYECAGAYQLPKNPEDVWSDEWSGWDDFLGVTLAFEDAIPVARSLNLESASEYVEMFAAKDDIFSEDKLASRLPYKPDLFYKNEWMGWDYFLREQ